ncbi:MAG: sulfurtransferase complex subunit TusD [Vibrionaceae bacterium]
MSLRFVLLVTGSVYGAQSAYTAFRFATALLKKGHQLPQVFFYHDGVLNASALVSPASDEFDLVNAWQELAKNYHVELQTCVAAALRRGVVNKEEAQLQQLPAFNMADFFAQSGLGSLAEALLSADRVVQF